MNDAKHTTPMASFVTNAGTTDAASGRIELPTEFSRGIAGELTSAAPGRGFEQVTLRVDVDSVAALMELAQSRGSSLEACIASAWALVLSRLGGHDDFPIGLQTPALPAGAVATLRADVRAPTLDLLVPGIDAAMKAARSVFQAQEPLQAGLAIGIAPETASSSFDLLLAFEPPPMPGAGGVSQGLSLTLRYATGLFTRPTAERWAGYVLNLLSAMPAHATARIDALPMIGAVERRLIEGFNATTEDLGAPACVHQLVEAQAARSPRAVAVVLGTQSLRYDELDARANLLAGALRARGVGPDVPVALYVERSIDMVVGLLAVLKAGGAYVPLDPSHPPERTATILGGALPRVILTQSSLLAALPATPATPDVETLLLDAPADAVAPFAASESGAAARRGVLTPDNLAYVIYTSGSTGTPKGVAMHHGALVNLLRWQAAHPAVAQPQRTLQFAALGFDVAFQEIFATLSVGGTLVLIDESVRRDPQALAGVMRAQNVERLFLPFIALQNLAEYAVAAGESLPALQDVMTAGEQLHASPAVRAFFERMPGCRLHNQYGPTESHVVTALQLGADPREWAALPSIGRPMEGSAAQVDGSAGSSSAVTTWLSVGPYWLCRRQPGRRAKKARTAGLAWSCSPAVITSCRSGSASSAATMKSAMFCSAMKGR